MRTMHPQRRGGDRAVGLGLVRWSDPVPRIFTATVCLPHTCATPRTGRQRDGEGSIQFRGGIPMCGSASASKKMSKTASNLTDERCHLQARGETRLLDP